LEESEMMMMNCCLEEYGGNLSALENDSLSHSIYTPLSLPGLNLKQKFILLLKTYLIILIQ